MHFSAFVLGTMAPDFEYFLKGRPSAEIGHSYLGFFLFNLPLVFAVYLLYKLCVHDVLIVHLPKVLQEAPLPKLAAVPLLKFFVFVYSALFGMFTHVAWDSFTHVGGLMVRRFSIFTYEFVLFTYSIPLYKILQHGSTVFGMTAIFGYVLYRAKKNPLPANRSVTVQQKGRYWLLIAFCAACLLLAWNLLSPAPLSAYGIFVVRLFDCALLSLLAVSIFTGKSRAQPR